ncbi:3-phosphoinositide-dependent protein kinase, putative [Phytophthora infestans T30-4]|uniref:3-phosphoinositide-dependent protein kinase, putative n=1 Tax=Phytophthora infestans (strain T30-4) TaxID=403677 RepID=D0MY53_PHYIT|nr:3-phosphoinositide-dependent protein kinase, putative [Phytophthora infestans T30-4]EEY66101.1 3-phosphoinositide-dependent protein kinase, putative [Phytophthora infestans T30-4]|eukprot:XP_002906700.1 3-phosphoinositide-dependent protein kinase, putative [Phytophthora infestans T30-4]
MTISPKDATDKPKIEEFAQGKSLGEGNFSRILEATHTATGERFALKVIEKQRIKRLRLRHQNIFNEINMEKEALNHLRHPNIIRLYQTFQDDNNLYFLLELLNGGELLSHLLHEGRQVGLDEDLARFYLADVVNAVEYMHSNQMLHRDLKPENMVVCKDTGGHLKLIDFGTAKNLADNKLNGPNFVGTPEYMPPETIDNKEPTYASDMWAFGCIVYQILTGETPFSGGSAYLTFLRVQDGSYYLPDYLSNDAKDLISKLLQKVPTDRLGGTESNAMSAVKAHPFFKDIDFDNHVQAQQPASHFCGPKLFPLVKNLAAMEKARNTQDSLTFDGDILQEQIKALSSRDTSILMHVLRRKHILHLPGLYPRFFSSVSRGRCLYARNQGYVGLTHDLQNQWSDTFSFMQLSGPKLGHAAALTEADNRGGSVWETESATFLEAVKVLNYQQPAFVVICGDFVNAKPSQEFYTAQVVAFQELLNQIKPQIRLVFAAGSDEFDSKDELAKYQERFGDSRFSFWFGGIKCIVINTAMLCHAQDFEEEIPAQTEWMKKELENGKLCARGTVVFSGHSLSPTVIGDSNNDGPNNIPEQLREKYWDMIKNGQACLVVSGNSTNNNVTSIVTKASEEGADEYKCEVVACKAPLGGVSSVIHHTKVSQSGVHSLLTPEEEGQETVLAAEMVTINVNSARND